MDCGLPTRSCRGAGIRRPCLAGDCVLRDERNSDSIDGCCCSEKNVADSDRECGYGCVNRVIGMNVMSVMNFCFFLVFS